jgi:drug/metabolite transporter (DMT)-like permease
VPPELADLAASISLTPTQAIGIPIALFGAVLISLGTQLQHSGVVRVDADTETSAKAGLSIGQLFALLARPAWLGGTLLLGVAVLFQLTSLGFAPLIVVQPLGAIALVVTAVMNSRISGVKLDAISIRAIAMCVGGVGLFVTIAALTAKSSPITERQLITVLVVLAVVLTGFALVFGLFRRRLRPIFFIIGAGVLFGFVVTLAKVVIDSVKTLTFSQLATDGVAWLTVVCLVGLACAGLLGSYFVQTAYSNGPPDLVVAGLTVIDPLVAISIGVVVLGEAADAPPWAIVAFLIAGGVAIFGVYLLAKHHPQSQH